MSLLYYVIQVKSRGEKKYLELAEAIVRPRNISVFWPRRNLRVRRAGLWHNVQSPIFPGYVFLETDSIGPELYWALKRVPGFVRFLRQNQDIQPMPERDARILATLLSLGEVVSKSTATFDRNNRIRIVEGPLKGMEGRIVRVNRRKGRIKVKLDLYEESYLVDFGFQSIEETGDARGETPNSGEPPKSDESRNMDRKS